MIMGLLDKKKMVASIVGSDEKSEKPAEKEYSKEELKRYAKEGLMSKFCDAVEEKDCGKALYAFEKLLEMCTNDNPGNHDY